MSKNWKSLRTAIMVLVAGALLAASAGILYINAEATPLHPQPESAPSVTRADPSPQWSGAVDRARQIVRAGLAEQNLPGLSVAVGVGGDTKERRQGVPGDIVWAEGFGWADMRTSRRVAPDTRFRIGTASTGLTSAAVGVLLEQGRLKLDDEIQAYVPQFPTKQWPVTLRQLMGHVGGVGTDDEGDAPLSRRRCERPVEAVPQFADAALLGQPFLTFMREQVFRPLGMDDTGAESATKENPEDVGGPGEDPPPFTLIRELILEPLGVGGTKANSPTGETPDPATFYVPGWGPHPDFRHGLHVRHPRNLSCYAGAMAFFSTPSDLVRFGLAKNGGTLLQPATAQLLQTPQPLTGELLGAKVMSLMTSGDSGIVVAVMSNASYADTSALARKVAEAFATR